jgi:hypothetical protein
VFAAVTDVGEQERAVVDAPLRGQHQESVGLDAPAVAHDPGDRLLVGGPVIGAWRPGVGGVHDAFLTTCRRTRPGSGVGTASSRTGVLPPEAVAGGERAARWARRRSLQEGWARTCAGGRGAVHDQAVAGLHLA